MARKREGQKIQGGAYCGLTRALSDPLERNKYEHKSRQTETGASREAIGGFAEATLLCCDSTTHKKMEM